MTSHDYNKTMTRSAGVAELKARLSEYLAAVKRGRSVTVLDRGQPIARLVPYDAAALEVRKATRQVRDLQLPRPPARPVDSLAVLLEDRGRR